MTAINRKILGAVTLTLVVTAMFVVTAVPALAHYPGIDFNPDCLESDGTFDFVYTITAATATVPPAEPEDLTNPVVEVFVSYDGGVTYLRQPDGAFVMPGLSFDGGPLTAPAGTATVSILVDPIGPWGDGTSTFGDWREGEFNAPTELCEEDGPPPPPPPPPPATGAIGDLVWMDANADGYQGDFEAGVAGVAVNLLNNRGLVIATTVTDAGGTYLFTGLAAGVYEVEFVLPAGFEVSPINAADDAVDSDAGVAGRTGAITLPSGVTDLTWDAGIFETPEVLPQVITTASTSTPPETLPFTGAINGGVGGIAFALLALGWLVLLAIRRREEEAVVVEEGWHSRLDFYHLRY